METIIWGALFRKRMARMDFTSNLPLQIFHSLLSGGRKGDGDTKTRRRTYHT